MVVKQKPQNFVIAITVTKLNFIFTKGLYIINVICQTLWEKLFHLVYSRGRHFTSGVVDVEGHGLLVTPKPFASSPAHGMNNKNINPSPLKSACSVFQTPPRCCLNIDRAYKIRFFILSAFHCRHFFYGDLIVC